MLALIEWLYILHYILIKQSELLEDIDHVLVISVSLELRAMLGIQKAFHNIFEFVLISQIIPHRILASPGKQEDLTGLHLNS